MDLEKTGMIGARVQVGNVSSQRVLEKVGAERMMEYFMVSS
jgi:RimJ/RimL family protein N-acetyltransferase